MTTPFAHKSTIEEIRARFDQDVERFSNLETGQQATIDAPLVLELVAQAARGHHQALDTPNPRGGSGGVPPVVFAFPPHQFRALTFTNVTGSVKMGSRQERGIHAASTHPYEQAQGYPTASATSDVEAG